MRLKGFITERHTDVTIIADTLRGDCISFVDDLKNSGLIYRGRNVHDKTAASVRGKYGLYRMKSRLEDRKPLSTDPKMHDEVNKVFERKFGWKVRNGVFTKGVDVVGGYGESHIFFPIGDYEFVWSPMVKDLWTIISVFWFLFRSDPDDNDVLANYALDIAPWREGNSEDGDWVDKNGNVFAIHPTFTEIDHNHDELKKKKHYMYYYREPRFMNRLYWKSHISLEEWLRREYKKFRKVVEEEIGGYKDSDLHSAIRSRHEISFKCDEYYLVDKVYEDFLRDTFVKGKGYK